MDLCRKCQRKTSVGFKGFTSFLFICSYIIDKSTNLDEILKWKVLISISEFFCLLFRCSTCHKSRSKWQTTNDGINIGKYWTSSHTFLFIFTSQRQLSYPLWAYLSTANLFQGTTHPPHNYHLMQLSLRHATVRRQLPEMMPLERDTAAWYVTEQDRSEKKFARCYKTGF